MSLQKEGRKLELRSKKIGKKIIKIVKDVMNGEEYRKLPELAREMVEIEDVLRDMAEDREKEWLDEITEDIRQAFEQAPDWLFEEEKPELKLVVNNP